MKDKLLATESTVGVRADKFTVRQALVGLELGDTDQALLSYLANFFRNIPVDRMHFLHVVPEVDFVHALYEKQAEAMTDREELKLQIEARMRETVGERGKEMQAGVLNYVVRTGSPFREMLHNAEEYEADLVIIGQKAGTRSHGILAKKLARKIRCNALIIPEHAGERLQNILVPVDFSEYSVQALKTAIALRNQLGEHVTITCIHVYHFPNFSSYNISRTPTQFFQMIESDRTGAFRTFLDNYATRYKSVIKTALIKKERPGTAKYIMDYADEHGSDLIIMGSKGHSNMELVMLGSVTESVLQMNDRKPTLILK